VILVISIKLQIPWKNKHRIIGLWRSIDFIIFSKWWLYIRTGSLIFWGAVVRSKNCPDNHQGFGSIFATRTSLVRNLPGFHLYSTSFARLYMIVTRGVMILPLFFMALISRWNYSSLLPTIRCEKMAVNLLKICYMLCNTLVKLVGPWHPCVQSYSKHSLQVNILF